MIDPFFIFTKCDCHPTTKIWLLSYYDCLVLLLLLLLLFVVVCDAVISLWPHESFDKRAEHREYLFKNNEEWNETCERIIETEIVLWTLQLVGIVYFKSSVFGPMYILFVDILSSYFSS